MTEKLLTTPEIAVVLKKSRKHDTNLLTTKRLRGRKFGQTWRVRPADLQENLSSNPFNDSEAYLKQESSLERPARQRQKAESPAHLAELVRQEVAITLAPLVAEVQRLASLIEEAKKS